MLYLLIIIMNREEKIQSYLYFQWIDYIFDSINHIKSNILPLKVSRKLNWIKSYFFYLIFEYIFLYNFILTAL